MAPCFKVGSINLESLMVKGLIWRCCTRSPCRVWTGYSWLHCSPWYRRKLNFVSALKIGFFSKSSGWRSNVSLGLVLGGLGLLPTRVLLLQVDRCCVGKLGSIQHPLGNFGLPPVLSFSKSKMLLRKTWVRTTPPLVSSDCAATTVCTGSYPDAPRK